MTESSGRLTLPPNPPGIKMLTTDASRALNDRLPIANVSVEKCITCKGRKTFRWYDDNREPADYDCNCAEQYLLHRWLLNSGVMHNYQRLGWADFLSLPDDVIAVAADYTENREAYIGAGIGLVLSGTRGTGKTLLAHLIVKDLIGHGHSCYATTFSDMIDRYAEGWRDKASGRWFDDTVRNSGFLLIDDLGRERNKGVGSVGENMLEVVTRHRTSTMQPTIITTNLTREEVAKGYGGHTMSLLMERAVFCDVNGPDRREEINQRVIREARLGLTRPVVLR